MRRREFITLVGGATAWSIAAHSQPRERMRRVGMLLPATSDDSEYPMLVKTFVEGVQQLGWTEGRNVRIDIRWAGVGADTNRKYAEELVASAPDVIMASGNASPLLAQSGHTELHRKCPLSGAKRTLRLQCEMSAFGPKRTFRKRRGT